MTKRKSRFFTCVQNDRGMDSLASLRMTGFVILCLHSVILSTAKDLIIHMPDSSHSFRMTNNCYPEPSSRHSEHSEGSQKLDSSHSFRMTNNCYPEPSFRHPEPSFRHPEPSFRHPEQPSVILSTAKDLIIHMPDSSHAFRMTGEWILWQASE